MLNQINEEHRFPEALQKFNITTLHKKKFRNNLDNYRGIFRISIFRSILDRLIYDDSYEIIDSNLTDGNAGGRKNRSAQDNVFVLGAVTNSVINSDSKPVQAQVMDIKTYVDKLWLEACINSLYENDFKK